MGTGHIRRFSTQIAVSLALTGCIAAADGPSPTEPHGFTTTTVSPTTTTTVSLVQGLVDYRNCLAERGVSIGEITMDGLGRPRMAAAMADIDLIDRVVLDALDECGPELVTGALDLSPDPALRAMVQESLEDFSECVRAQGVESFPDPVPVFSGVGAPLPISRIPWGDPGLPDAVTVCTRPLRPSSP